MIRIKLPGNDKAKRILLIFLVIIAIFIIIFEANKNSKAIKTGENSTKTNNETIIKDSNEVITKTAEIMKGNTDDEENNLYNEAYNLFFSKEYDKSIGKSNEIISKYPNSYKSYNIRGIAKAYSGDYNGGMKDIDKSLEINNQYGYARFNKGLAYELYGYLDNALAWYKKDLDIEEYVWSYYGIASIYGRRGDVENTIKYLNKATAMNSEVKNIAKIEQDFDPVKDSKEFKEAVYD